METKEAASQPEARRQGFADTKEASEFLNIGRVSVYAMMRDGQLPSTKIRNARRIPWSALYAIADAAMQTEGGAA
jgi:excisionase family DNA binding protein